MRLSDETIRKRPVIAADGQVIGEVSAVFLEVEGWRIESLRVSLLKEIADQLGAHRTIFRAGEVEIPVHMIQSVSTTILLTVPVDGLRAVLPSDPPPAQANP